MWKPSIQEFYELFIKEYVLNIMVVMNSRIDKSITPTELSDVLQIHVSTAKKYLELLAKYEFASKLILTEKLGRPTVYTLKTTTINISLNLEKDTSIEDIDVEIWNPTMREVKNIDQIATYVFDSDDLLKEIKVKSLTKAKRFVTQTIELSKNEQQFMKYLPFSTEEAKPLIKICNKAKIEAIVDIKAIENFVKKLLKYDLIEISG